MLLQLQCSHTNSLTHLITPSALLIYHGAFRISRTVFHRLAAALPQGRTVHFGLHFVTNGCSALHSSEAALLCCTVTYTMYA